MGAYKYYNPSTQQWEIVKSKSIIKSDGSLEYTPDDIKLMDDKIGILTTLSTTTGAANTYSVIIDGVTSLQSGLKIAVQFHVANTGASTLNINGLGAKSIRKAGGAALTSGNLKATGVYSLVYDGTSFQLQGEGGEYGTAQASHVLTGYSIGTDDGLVNGSMPNRGAISQALSINGSYTIPAGYHSGAGKVSQSITTKGAETFAPSTSSRTIASGRYLTGTQTISPIVGTAVRGDVLSGKTFNSASAGIAQTGTMTNRGTVTNTLTTQGGSYTIPSGYHSGSGKVTASFANLVAGNVKSGVNIGGVVGSLLSNPIFNASWTQRTSSFGLNTIMSVTYGQGMFVAVGGDGKLATSTNGTTWTQRTSSFGSTFINGVTYGQGMFVAVGSSGKLATSTNGTTWTQRTSSFGTGGIMSVTYGQGMFVAVGYNGKLATSTDGITWTQRTSNIGNAIESVTYGQGMFVAVGNVGKLATSTDGITWTTRTNSFGSNNINGVTYDQGMFVAVGANGKLATSTDGITWTQRTSSFGSSHINNVTYGQGMFVAVDVNGQLAISTNGTTWTQRTSSFGSNAIESVTYGQGMFVAVGYAGNLATLS